MNFNEKLNQTNRRNNRILISDHNFHIVLLLSPFKQKNSKHLLRVGFGPFKPHHFHTLSSSRHGSKFRRNKSG